MEEPPKSTEGEQQNQPTSKELLAEVSSQSTEGEHQEQAPTEETGARNYDSAPLINDIPDITPSNREKMIELNRLEKQRKKDRKREKKQEIRRKWAERTRLVSVANDDEGSGMQADGDSSSDDGLPRSNRQWRTAGDKKKKGDNGTMDTEEGLFTPGHPVPHLQQRNELRVYVNSGIVEPERLRQLRQVEGSQEMVALGRQESKSLSIAGT
ncbi:hypothetical protein R1flu_016468 [Riccia fluitans]|uniref:Uncharacterized protein n=1 Tax=Riccia fluitans TaxID=41844 RepID=A0ABD1YQ07_9MARC